MSSQIAYDFLAHASFVPGVNCEALFQLRNYPPPEADHSGGGPNEMTEDDAEIWRLKKRLEVEKLKARVRERQRANDEAALRDARERVELPIIESPHKYGSFDDLDEDDLSHINNFETGKENLLQSVLHVVSGEPAGEPAGAPAPKDEIPTLEPETSAERVPPPRLELGRWANERLEEAKKFAALVRGGKAPDMLKTTFPALFAQVFDQMEALSREKLFNACARRGVSVSECFAALGEVKGLSGHTCAPQKFRKRLKQPNHLSIVNCQRSSIAAMISIDEGPPLHPDPARHGL
jgi:hypothetical protein